MIGAAKLSVGAAIVLTLVQPDAIAEYVDTQDRLQFLYPASFGTPSPGTNDGFGDRVASIRFSVFSAGLGGEAVLTRGFPLVDLQAVGGLYDSIALEVFPDPIRSLVVGTLTPLSVDNFCQQLAIEQHLDPTNTALDTLTLQQQAAALTIDRMRRVSPRVVLCAMDGATIPSMRRWRFSPAAPDSMCTGPSVSSPARTQPFKSSELAQPPTPGCSNR